MTTQPRCAGQKCEKRMRNKTKGLPDQSTLKELLSYDPATGSLKWKPRKPKHFVRTTSEQSQKSMRSWNTRYAGKEAITAKDRGYRTGRILGIRCYAHKVIWKLVHGVDSPYQVDHKNHMRDDNRLENLRCVTHKQNGRNQSRPINNTSGYVGVNQDYKNNRWSAQIMVDGKNIRLGRFVEKQEAVAARRAADHKYGFHQNHGK